MSFPKFPESGDTIVEEAKSSHRSSQASFVPASGLLGKVNSLWNSRSRWKLLVYG